MQANEGQLMRETFLDYLMLFSQHTPPHNHQRLPAMDELQFLNLSKKAYIEVICRGGGIWGIPRFMGESYIFSEINDNAHSLGWLPTNIFNGLVGALYFDLKRRLFEFNAQHEPDWHIKKADLRLSPLKILKDKQQSSKKKILHSLQIDDVISYLDCIRHRLQENDGLYCEVLEILHDFELRKDLQEISSRIENLLSDYPELLEPSPFPWECHPGDWIEYDQRSPVLSPLSPQKFSILCDNCVDNELGDLRDRPVAYGGNADIWIGRFKGEKVAIKVARMFQSNGYPLRSSKVLKKLWREFAVWSSLQHKNILKCLGFTYAFSLEGYRGLPALVSPWMENGTVIDYLEKNPNADRLQLILGLAAGLVYLHSHTPPIIHGDIRAANVLVSNSGIPCIGDFGLSRVLSYPNGYTSSSGPAGSIRWMSPELLLNCPTSKSSDVWAFGMTILEIITGKPPYNNITLEPAVLRDIMDGKLPARPSRGVSISLWKLCIECWAWNPVRRLGMETAFKRLRFMEELRIGF